MDAERWKKLEDLFGRACELPAEQRPTFLEHACPDPGLRLEVERLLSADRQSRGFLARPAPETALAPGSSGFDPPAAPRTIGPYSLIRKIGMGGLSTVWLAIRTDVRFQRRVAVKLLRHGMADSEQLRRLHRERQILASLEHPHVARLYDTGTTPEGLPYFVMEYIEGDPITAFCDRRRLTVAERLELFRQVCAAVHYAHQNLVVHRDLKPKNILVTEDGVPKLLDFGVAKVSNPELLGPDLQATGPRQRFLTPEYASPEQIRGEPVTTASDVYSLGVILYELLSGRRPRYLEDGLLELGRSLLDQDPLPPSLAVNRTAEVPALDGSRVTLTPASVSRARKTQEKLLARRLRGDLDTIVAKALCCEPQRRYASAEALAEDLRRHADGRPVMARKPTAGYRLGRLVRRNEKAALGILAFVIVLAVAAIGLGVLSGRLARQRDQAAQERDRARLYADVLKEVFAASDPLEAFGDLYPSRFEPAERSRRLTAREILERSAERVARLPEDQVEVRADLLATLGKIYDRLGEHDRARPLLESALASRRDLFAPPHPALAESLAHLGTLRLHMGELAAAEELHRRALAMRTALFGREHPDAASSMRQLAMTLIERGDYEAAEELSRRALAVHSALDPHGPEAALGMLELARILWNRGKLAEAESMNRSALAVSRALYGSDHVFVGQILNNLALVLQGRGELDEAELLLQEARGIFSALLEPAHPDLISVRANLASLAAFRRDYEKAEKLYAVVFEVAEEALGASHPDLAYLLLGIGVSRNELGRPAQAEPFLRRALAIRRQVLPEGNYLTARAEVYLANCLIRLERFAEAESLLLSGYAAIAGHRPPRERETGQVLNRLIQLYQAWGRDQEAARYQKLRAELP